MQRSIEGEEMAKVVAWLAECQKKREAWKGKYKRWSQTGDVWRGPPALMVCEELLLRTPAKQVDCRRLAEAILEVADPTNPLPLAPCPYA